MKRADVVVSFILFLALLLLLVDATLILVNGNGTLEERIARYERLRKSYLEQEQKQQFGGDTELSEIELLANEHLMKVKHSEYDKAFVGESVFKPSQHFFKTFEQTTETPLFKLLRLMPKGGALHVHDIAICSVDCLMGFTYMEDLWVCTNGDSYDALRFAREKPVAETTCQWQLLEQLRNDSKEFEVDDRLAAQFTLYPQEHFVDGYDVWRVFGKIFRLVYGLLTYAPVWENYILFALEEFYNDGVQYLEIRSTLPILYDLNGTNYTISDTVHLWENATAVFCKYHRDFVGAKLIYSPTRRVNDSVFDGYLENAVLLMEKFPNFFAGFDLVGHEDAGRPLHDFAHKLLAVNNKMNFYFHAGETNWYGTSTDENLVDALLLGTKRIGHGYAIVKHPELLKVIRHYDIAIEVNPISNQVLQHVSDLRNHPCSILFAGNYPVVISSDDSAYWRATPLTHDFYAAFLGIASKSANMGMLKKLIYNSITYSALDDERKKVAMEVVESQWNAWIRYIVAHRFD